MAPGVSLSSPLSVKQIFWSVFLYTFVALTDLMGYRCGWFPLRFPLKELHIHVQARDHSSSISPASGGILKQPPAKRTSVQHRCMWTLHRCHFNVLQNDLIFLSSTQLSLIYVFSYILHIISKTEPNYP